jgi:hypothetical protein
MDDIVECYEDVLCCPLQCLVGRHVQVGYTLTAIKLVNSGVE